MISKSTLQTYTSALPLMSSDTSLIQQIDQNVSVAKSDSKSGWHGQRMSYRDVQCCCSNGSLIAMALWSKNNITFLDCVTDTREGISIDGRLKAMVFSPSGTHLALATTRGRRGSEIHVAVYNVETYARVHSFTTKHAFTEDIFITCSTNGATILIMSASPSIPSYNNTVEVKCSVHDGLTGSIRISKTMTVSQYYPRLTRLGIALSPDGRKLAMCNETGVQLWDVDSSELVDIVFKRPYELHSWDMNRCIVCWSPGVTFLALVSPGESTVRLWSFRDQSCWTADIEHSTFRASRALNFSSDSSRLAFASSYNNAAGITVFKIQVWDTQTGKNIGEETCVDGPAVFQPCQNGGRLLSLYPDGQEIIVISMFPQRTDDEDDFRYTVVVYLLSDISPAYMTDPPISRDFKQIPNLSLCLSSEISCHDYASKIDANGWILTLEGKRVLLTPYPSFEVSAPLFGSLEIRHPETKKTVLKYVFEQGQAIPLGLTSDIPSRSTFHDIDPI